MDMDFLTFRAKRAVDGEWVIGTLVNIGAYVGISPYKDCHVAVDVSTLGMWCGIMDIRGLMVFDGDRVMAYAADKDMERVYRIRRTASGFVAIGDDNSKVSVDELRNVRIQGNMFDDKVKADGKRDEGQ